ncbi:hypothetical protein [Corynebacterium macginleyi]|uniref:hypothetical protein n=1 Tax=Corynebacterium macginleyi TaxID=38290 RepID=UPI00190DB1D7|nr:hypothetical protein [Corynebacterium macginleyi]MBK4138151.1 hypothetical protein [Corynebacterium macginleyi]MBK4145873.1 hypothetical protein [Corynebacterium macginleyi]MBM0262050.1 hypothetical protein [Corynebacterium macginleyi]
MMPMETTESRPTTTTQKNNTEMQAIGLNFGRWQDAVEAAIATDRLAVTGEVRGGQLIQYGDPSGAQINILAVEPYATFIGFDAVTQGFAHVEMFNDVLAIMDIIDPFGTPLAQVTANLAQGPLLAEEPRQEWQQVSLTAMGLDITVYESPAAFEAETGKYPALFESAGAHAIASGSGAQAPTPAATFAARVMEADWRTNDLSGEKFAHLVMDGLFPFDLCLPADRGDLPAKDTVISGTALLTASIDMPSDGCGGGGCGCGSGGCGCGGH